MGLGGRVKAVQGVRVYGLGFRVWIKGLGVQGGLGFSIQDGIGFRA